METIKIQYNTTVYGVDGIQKICGNKSDWIDLRASKSVHLQKGEFALIPLGVRMELPEGYEAHIAPRSSTFKHFGVIMTNSIGIVDSSFKGREDYWMFPVYALRDTDINAGDRICQFRIVEKQPEINFVEEDWVAENRGGIGSTGKN